MTGIGAMKEITELVPDSTSFRQKTKALVLSGTRCLDNRSIVVLSGTRIETLSKPLVRPLRQHGACSGLTGEPFSLTGLTFTAYYAIMQKNKIWRQFFG